MCVFVCVIDIQIAKEWRKTGSMSTSKGGKEYQGSGGWEAKERTKKSERKREGEREGEREDLVLCCET